MIKVFGFLLYVFIFLPNSVYLYYQFFQVHSMYKILTKIIFCFTTRGQAISWKVNKAKRFPKQLASEMQGCVTKSEHKVPQAN